MYFPLFVGVLCLSLFWYALPCIISSFAIILKRKREPVALLLLFVGILCWSLFWYALFCVLSSFAIILTRKRELVTFLYCILLCYFVMRCPGSGVVLDCIDS